MSGIVVQPLPSTAPPGLLLMSCKQVAPYGDEVYLAALSSPWLIPGHYTHWKDTVRQHVFPQLHALMFALAARRCRGDDTAHVPRIAIWHVTPSKSINLMSLYEGNHNGRSASDVHTDGVFWAARVASACEERAGEHLRLRHDGHAKTALSAAHSSSVRFVLMCTDGAAMYEAIELARSLLSSPSDSAELAVHLHVRGLSYGPSAASILDC